MKPSSAVRRAISLALLLATAFVSAESNAAGDVELRGVWEQGSLLIGQAPAGTRIEVEGRELNLAPDGGFVIGLDRDAKPDLDLHVTLPGGKEKIEHHAVAPRKWDVQRIDGLPEAQVNPPPETEARIAREAMLIKAAHARDTDRDDCFKSFVWPAKGRISGVFGSQRILNGTPKAAHYGLDVAVPTGTPVRTPLGGVVALAEPDLYFTGGTLIIDHGHGLSTVLVHLSKLLVKVGDEVPQGAVVAQSGMTGRATGPHLHWGEYWFDAHLDPQRLVPPMPGR